jgi:hypothetical protein
MPYSDDDMFEIERDPVRLKAYFWHIAQHWRRMATQHRARSQAMEENIEAFEQKILPAGDRLVGHI